MYFSCVYLTLPAMRRQSKNGVEQIWNMFSWALRYKCKRKSRAWLFPIILAQFHSIFHRLDAHLRPSYFRALLAVFRKTITHNNRVWKYKVCERFSCFPLDFFLMYQKLLFTIFMDLRLQPVYFSFLVFYSHPGYNIDFNSKITLDICNCILSLLQMGKFGLIWSSITRHYTSMYPLLPFSDFFS